MAALTKDAQHVLERLCRHGILLKGGMPGKASIQSTWIRNHVGFGIASDIKKEFALMDWKTIDPQAYPPHGMLLTSEWHRFLTEVQVAAIECCTDLHTLCLLTLAADSSDVRRRIEKRILWLKGGPDGRKGTGSPKVRRG